MCIRTDDRKPAMKTCCLEGRPIGEPPGAQRELFEASKHFRLIGGLIVFHLLL